MAKASAAKRQQKSRSATTPKQPQRASALRPRESGEPKAELEPLVHLLGPGKICDTERRGHPTPKGRSPFEIVLDASNGFIPLWEEDTVLRWRFRERSMDYFEDVAAATAEIRRLFGEALLEWGSAAPVTFTYDDDLWDFEIVMRSGDDCNSYGCTLAAAFFPDNGRHQLQLYPKMFTQSRKEQVETFVHEIGHVFGLRHFFANIDENDWPSEIFGRHHKFSIMNYGELSKLTDADREDLTLLYQSVWSGELTHINGTRVRLIKPYSANAPAPDSAMAASLLAAALRPRSTAPSHPTEARRAVARPRSRASRLKAAYLDQR